MDFLLEETVPAADLKKFETRYNEEIRTAGKVSSATQFEYAWCLVRSKYPADIRKGIVLLEDLFQVSLQKAQIFQNSSFAMSNYRLYTDIIHLIHLDIIHL